LDCCRERPSHGKTYRGRGGFLILRVEYPYVRLSSLTVRLESLIYLSFSMSRNSMCRHGHLRAVPIALFWAAISMFAGGCRDRSQTPPSPDSKSPQGTTSSALASAATPEQVVQLVIDYGDGAQKRFSAIPWRDGMTVLDVLQSAQQRPHGVTLTVRGSGEAALLTKLDDQANEEGAAGARNWLFYVNDHLADKSLGAATVKSGDTILWKFERYVE
jgi:Domain of unknown function (DUF4430)